jgi:hypothetical protein
LTPEAAFGPPEAWDMTQADEKDQRPDAEDWESIALRRVARHVETLPDSPPNAEDFGWEEAVLQKLRKRLSDE